MRSVFLILHYKNYNNTFQCVKSIKKYNPNIDIIIVSNDSNNKNNKLLKKNLSKVILIKNNKNLGFGKGINIGIKYSRKKYKFIICLNNDILLRSSLNINLIKKKFKSDKKLALIGLKTNEKNINKKNSFQNLVFRNELNTKENTIINYLGAAFIIRTDLPNNINFLSEKLFLYCEEFIHCFKILKNGYKIQNFKLCNLIHKRKKTALRNYSIYYEIRNFIIIFLEEKMSLKSWLYLYFWIFKQLSKNLLHIKIVLKAIRDGFRNTHGQLK